LTASYADLLLLQGWNDPAALQGLLTGWINLYRLFQPDVAVLDYAPNARLGARIVGTPCVQVGTGFSLPPATTPLPPMPGFPWATPDRARESEQHALERVNGMMDFLGESHLESLQELFAADPCLLLTFPELDHYGPRPSARYLGPLMECSTGEVIDWPQGHTRRRVLAYLRPAEMSDFNVVMQGIVATDAAVVCYAPGVTQDALVRFSNSRTIFSPKPVQFSRLFADADVCVSYAPSGTVAASLLSGVPQLLAPAHVEAELTSHRVESMGAGLVLRGGQTPVSVASSIHRVVDGSAFQLRAREFAERYRAHDSTRIAEEIAIEVEDIAER
jgi:UDP:flavonoid glycosyltransferase YjiC (YdhE family)